MITRRTFLVGLVTNVCTAPLSFAQKPGRTYRLGYLASGSASARSDTYQVAFFDRLHELGYIEGRNLVIEYRSAQGKFARLPELAAELGRGSYDALLVTNWRSLR